MICDSCEHLRCAVSKMDSEDFGTVCYTKFCTLLDVYPSENIAYCRDHNMIKMHSKQPVIPRKYTRFELIEV